MQVVCSKTQSCVCSFYGGYSVFAEIANMVLHVCTSYKLKSICKVAWWKLNHKLHVYMFCFFTLNSQESGMFCTILGYSQPRANMSLNEFNVSSVESTCTLECFSICRARPRDKSNQSNINLIEVWVHKYRQSTYCNNNLLWYWTWLHAIAT